MIRLVLTVVAVGATAIAYWVRVHYPRDRDKR
jgi:hypothetical protein